MKISGKIQYKNIGVGTWALGADDGRVYELYNPPAELRHENLTVEIEGKIREDVMTLAMIGKILEVISFQIK